MIETIVDCDGEWICEGPCWQVERGDYRADSPQTAIGLPESARTALVYQFLPIKLAPVSELRAIKWKKAKQILFPYVVLVAIFSLPFLFAFS